MAVARRKEDNNDIKKKANLVIKEKVRKTPTNERGIYRYHSVDGTVYALVPGEDGISALDIELLHKLDDSEVYYNNKNLRPKRTKEEKAMINEWKQNYIKQFKEEYGYEPNDVDVNYAVEEVFPRNYNLSINNDDINFDKSELGLLASSQEMEAEDWSDKMMDAMDEMTDKQREVIQFMFVDGLKQNEVAEKLGVSAAAVNKHFNKARAIIKKYF